MTVKPGEVVIPEGVQAAARSSIQEGKAWGAAGVGEPELFACLWITLFPWLQSGLVIRQRGLTVPLRSMSCPKEELCRH